MSSLGLVRRCPEYERFAMPFASTYRVCMAVKASDPLEKSCCSAKVMAIFNGITTFDDFSPATLLTSGQIKVSMVCKKIRY